MEAKQIDLERELEAARQRFMADWEAGPRAPLEAYLREYPRLAGELAEFAAAYFALRPFSAPEPPPVPAGDPVLTRARAALRVGAGGRAHPPR